MVATTVPYQMALTLIDGLTGAKVSETALQNMIERRGNAVLEREVNEAERYAPFQQNGLPVETQPEPNGALPTAPNVAYLELDGVLALTRTEAGNRLKLQRMRWSEDGARIMALLRADLFNGNWESTTKQLTAA